MNEAVNPAGSRHAAVAFSISGRQKYKRQIDKNHRLTRKRKSKSNVKYSNIKNYNQEIFNLKIKILLLLLHRVKN